MRKIYMLYGNDEEQGVKAVIFVVETTSDDGSMSELARVARYIRIADNGKRWVVEQLNEEDGSIKKRTVFHNYAASKRHVIEVMRPYTKATPAGRAPVEIIEVGLPHDFVMAAKTTDVIGADWI